MKEDIKKLGWDAQLLHRQHNQEDITESFFRQEIRKLAEKYANQRVIEELEESIKDVIDYKEGDNVVVDRILSRLISLKLKQ
jgi:hypothetical protein